MAKVITATELAGLVTGLLTQPEALGELDERHKHEAFMRDIANVVATHCGGEIGDTDWIEKDDDPDEEELVVIVRGDGSLPEGGGVWAAFDPDGQLD